MKIVNVGIKYVVLQHYVLEVLFLCSHVPCTPSYSIIMEWIGILIRWNSGTTVESMSWRNLELINCLTSVGHAPRQGVCWRNQEMVDF